LDHWHIPKGVDTTSPGFRKYYGFFWSGMPDFNFDNPSVRQEMMKIGRFWLDSVGVDGFRLDAAQHIYPDGQEASTQAWWREFRAEMEKTNPDFYMVGEVANNNKMVAPYLQKGMHAAFNFDLARDINEAALSGKDNGLVTRLIAIRSLYSSYSSDYIDATFITNHDQDRVMSNLQGDNRKAAMAASILLTLPGSPYLYYGEEVGMEGRKPDELIREPMPWSYSTVDKAQTAWEKPVYSVQEKVIPVDRQIADDKSLLNHYKRLIRLRKSNQALLKGDLSPVLSTDSRVMAYIRGGGDSGKVLVLHNLSGESAVFSGPEKALVAEMIFSNGKVLKGGAGIQLPPFSTVIYSLR
jgi:glycosidase